MISSPFRSSDNQNEDEEVILLAQEGRQNLSVWNGRGGEVAAARLPPSRHPILDTRTSVLRPSSVKLMVPPPWILKQGWRALVED